MIEAVVAPPGLHKYEGLEASVVAVSVAEPPAQIVAELTDTAGSEFTVSTAGGELVVDPELSVTTTV